MIDSHRSFAGQFTPVDGGYLYYPSRKSGGKLITTDELEELDKAWRRRVGAWKIAGVAMAAIFRRPRYATRIECMSLGGRAVGSDAAMSRTMLQAPPS
jgi:hypothetical protein